MSYYITRIIAIISFISIFLSSLLSYLNPAKGYELSIYSSTPIFVWILLLVSIAGGVTIIVHNCYLELYRSSNFWIMGFFILILSRATLLSIPFIRGYLSWNGDIMTHVGLTKDILFTGYTINNCYPVMHVFLSEISLISGFSINFVANYITILVSSFYVISIYLLSTKIFNSKKIQLLTFASVAGVLFDGYHIFLVPNGWSLMYLPFILFCYFGSLPSRDTSIKYRLLLVITLLFYPFFHPLSSAFIIMIFIILSTTPYLYLDNKNSPEASISKLAAMNGLLIEVIAFFSWILSFKVFHNNIKKIYLSITGGYNLDPIAQMGGTLDKMDLSTLEFLELIVKLMGDTIIFLILSAIAFIFLLKQQENKNLNFRTLFIIIFSIGFLYISYLLKIIPGLENIGSERFLSYLVIFTPIPAAFTLQKILCKKRKFGSLFCISIILIASTISVFSIYPSPYVLSPNRQVSQMDINGMDWFLTYNNQKVSTAHILTPVFRFADEIQGIQNNSYSRYGMSLPDHFNYSLNQHFGQSYNMDKYAIITMTDKVVYDSVWKVVGRFNKNDFYKLETDSTVDKLYVNGETDVWYIHSNI